VGSDHQCTTPNIPHQLVLTKSFNSIRFHLGGVSGNQGLHTPNVEHGLNGDAEGFCTAAGALLCRTACRDHFVLVRNCGLPPRNVALCIPIAHVRVSIRYVSAVVGIARRRTACCFPASPYDSANNDLGHRSVGQPIIASHKKALSGRLTSPL
jgi:hypothetical protein